MADVEKVVTLGIGSSPGNIRWFITVGLDVNVGTEPLGLTPATRSGSITAASRDVSLTAGTRGVALTPESRP